MKFPMHRGPGAEKSTTMDIQVTRQACCSADDQAGPLQAVYSVDEHCTLADLVERIRVSKFLQFSSTHNRLSGLVQGACVVEVLAGWGSKPEFHVDPAASVGSVIGLHTLDFCFLHAQ